MINSVCTCYWVNFTTTISDYENAFIHFSQANSLKYNDYDVATFETQVNSYIDYFSKENIASWHPHIAIQRCQFLYWVCHALVAA